MKFVASYFLINVGEASKVHAYNVSNPNKKIISLNLEEGIYLCFIDEVIMTKDIDDQFCEVLYKNEIIIVRYKDIVNLRL